ncbi:MAG: hypothetical protein ACR2P2_10585 [Nakamurella sp.]
MATTTCWTPGCGHGRGGLSCSGSFTSTDGHLQLGSVQVTGIQQGTSSVPGVLIRKINTHGVLTIQDRDTVYVNGNVGYAGNIVAVAHRRPSDQPDHNPWSLRTGPVVSGPARR